MLPGLQTNEIRIIAKSGVPFTPTKTAESKSFLERQWKNLKQIFVNEIYAPGKQTSGVQVEISFLLSQFQTMMLERGVKIETINNSSLLVKVIWFLKELSELTPEKTDTVDELKGLSATKILALKSANNEFLIKFLKSGNNILKKIIQEILQKDGGKNEGFVFLNQNSELDKLDENSDSISDENSESEGDSGTNKSFESEGNSRLKDNIESENSEREENSESKEESISNERTLEIIDRAECKEEEPAKYKYIILSELEKAINSDKKETQEDSDKKDESTIALKQALVKALADLQKQVNFRENEEINKDENLKDPLEDFKKPVWASEESKTEAQKSEIESESEYQDEFKRENEKHIDEL